MKIKSIIYCFLSLLISACASNVRSDWDCKLPGGGTCKEMSEIDNGYISNISDIENKSFLKKVEKENKNVSINYNSFEDLRTKEKVSRVMFAPYIDKYGYRHETSVVNYVEQKSDWIDE